MRNIFKVMMTVLVCASFVGCKIKDIPEVSIEQPQYIVASEASELIIEVNSTGIDDVDINYVQDYYEWEVDPSTGDLYPAEGWISVERIINNYEPKTRALPQSYSGVCLKIATNTSGIERQAVVCVRSFTRKAYTKIIQPSSPVADKE